jgi:hypothetical protein
MDQNIPIFRPRYPLAFKLGFISVPVLFFGMLSYGIGAPSLEPVIYWYLALVCGGLTAVFPFFFLREIRFVNDLVIRRYFLPDIFVNPREIYTIEAGEIYVRGLRIHIGPLENLEELKGMAKQWSAKQTLKAVARGQASAPLYLPSRGPNAYAGFWGLMFAVIVVILAPVGPSIDPRWPPGIAFLVVYFVFAYIVPKYL